MSFTSLISASVEKNDSEYIDKLNASMLSEGQATVLNWLRDYKKEYGSLPTKEFFMKTEHSLYWNDVLITTPLQSLFEETAKRASYDFIRTVTNDLETEYISTGEVDIETVKSKINSVTTHKDVKRPVSIMNRDRKEYYTKDESNRLEYGIPLIDKTTGGMKDGDFSLMISPTGVGKTTFSTILAVRAARGGNKVLLIPMESTDDEMLEGVDSVLASFNKRLFLRDTEEDKEELIKKLSSVDEEWEDIKLVKGDIHLPDKKKPITKPSQIREAIRLEIERSGKGYDLVIIDGLYQMNYDGNTSSSDFTGDDWRSLKILSTQLMRLAKFNPDGKTRIFCTTQVRAGLENNSTFSLGDIGFSKAISQEYNSIFSLGEINNVYPGLEDHEKSIIFALLKNRNGANNKMATNSLGVIDYKNSFLRFDNGSGRLGRNVTRTPLRIK